MWPVPTPLHYMFTDMKSEWSLQSHFCPICIVDIDAATSWAIKSSRITWKRCIDDKIADVAVDRQYVAVKTNPSIVLSQSLCTVHVHAGAAD